MIWNAKNRFCTCLLGTFELLGLTSRTRYEVRRRLRASARLCLTLPFHSRKYARCGAAGVRLRWFSSNLVLFIRPLRFMKSFYHSVRVQALALGSLLMAGSACSVSEQVKDKPAGKNASAEALENEAYTLMQYRLNFVDEAKLGGQDILFVRQASDIASPQQAQLQAALAAGNLPLHLRMRVYARNPSAASVQLRQLDYKLLLDGKELTAGATGANTQLEASAIETLPLNIDLNVKPAQLSGSTPAAFAAGFADFTAANRRLVVQIRPQYVGANGRQVPAADFMPAELVTAKRPATKK